MKDLTVLFWWILIFKYSLNNLKVLYNNNNLNTSSCIFIIACAIRSFFPRIDGKRICFFDIWVSYPLVGRIFATFGELAFVYQLKLVTQSCALKLNCHKIYYLMDIIMLFIFKAQVFCWYGVLFQQNIMHVIEESIWMVTMASIGLSYLYFSKLIKDAKIKSYCVYGFYFSCVYTIFMVCVDIPMYYYRHLESNNNFLHNNLNNNYYDRVKDLARCDKVSRSYDTWKNEIPWMTGYFIGATWLSLELFNFQIILVNTD
jgi:hypothetical protein